MYIVDNKIILSPPSADIYNYMYVHIHVYIHMYIDLRICSLKVNQTPCNLVLKSAAICYR